jgi:hypothetical protein
LTIAVVLIALLVAFTCGLMLGMSVNRPGRHRDLTAERLRRNLARAEGTREGDKWISPRR